MSEHLKKNITSQQFCINVPEPTLCLLCGGKAVYKTVQKGYQEPDLFEIYCCESCNSAFSMPRVNSNSVYELIYKNALSVQGYTRYQDYQNKVLIEKDPLTYLANSEPCYWGPVHAIQNILKLDKGAKILEVGSGLGYFTYSLKQSGYNIQGLDISQDAVDKANKMYGECYLCDDLLHFAEANLASFDLVIMTEVIEHLNEPKKFILSIKKLLKPDGKYIFTTPNKSFYPDAVSWHTDAPPVHCWWFSEKSVAYIANILNVPFKLVDFTDYYKKHPYINKIVSLDDPGHFIFDSNGKVLNKQEIKKNSFEMPQWIKKNSLYRSLRNSLFTNLYPEKYKAGGVQSNIICAILYMK